MKGVVKCREHVLFEDVTWGLQRDETWSVVVSPGATDEVSTSDAKKVRRRASKSTRETQPRQATFYGGA